MAAIKDLSRFNYVDEEGEQGESVTHHRECDGALLFSDEELVDSTASQIEFLGHINADDYFESSYIRELTEDEHIFCMEQADVSDNSKDMPALVEVLDSSDDKGAEVSGADINSNHHNNENNLDGDLPELEEVSDSSDDEDSYIYNAMDDLLDFPDEAEEFLAMDTLEEAYMVTY